MMPSDSPLYSEEPQQDEQAHQTSRSWRAVFLGAASQVGSFFSSIFYEIKVGVQGLWGSLKHIANWGWCTGSEQNQQHRLLLEQLVAEYELLLIEHKALSFNDESPLELLLLARLETPYNEDSDEIDDFLSKKLLQGITTLDFSRIVLSPRQPEFKDAIVILLKRNPHITSIQCHPEGVALLDDTIQKQLNNNKCLAVCDVLLLQDHMDERYEQRYVQEVRDALLNDPVGKITEAATFSLLEVSSEEHALPLLADTSKQAEQVAYRALLEAFGTHNELLIDECQDEFICAYAACEVREVTLRTVLLNSVKPDANIFIERFLALNPFIIKVTREDGLPLLSSTQQLLQERQIQRMSLHLLRAGAHGSSTTKLNAWNATCLVDKSAKFNRLTQYNLPEEQKESSIKALSVSLINRFSPVFRQLTEGFNAYLLLFVSDRKPVVGNANTALPHSASFGGIFGALEEKSREVKPDKKEPISDDELLTIGRDMGIDFPFDDAQFTEKKEQEVERIYALITDYEREPNRGKLYDVVYPEILYKGLLGRKNMQYSDNVHSREGELNVEMANIKQLIDDPLKLCKVKQFLVHSDKNPALKEKAEKVSRFVNDMKDWISAQADCSNLWPNKKKQAAYAVYLFQLAQGCLINREIKITRKHYKKEMEVIYAEMHREIDDLRKFYQDLSGTYQGISRRFEKVEAECDIFLQKSNASDTHHKHGYSEEEKLILIKKIKNGETLTEEEHEFAKKISQKVKKAQEKLTESQEEKSVGSIFSGVGHFSSSTVRKSVSDPSMTFQNLHDAQVGYKADSITRPASFTSSYS